MEDELREKIAKELFKLHKALHGNNIHPFRSWEDLSKEDKAYYRGDADQVLTPIPDIEETKQYHEAKLQRMALNYDVICKETDAISYTKGVLDGRNQEQERIQALYENMGCVPEEDNCWYQFWQALKGGK